MGRRVLALDQSSKVTGYAVFEDGALRDYGHFTCSDNDIAIRLMHIRQQVEQLIDKYNITEMVIEDIQLQEGVGNNVATFKLLAEVFGVITELSAEKDISTAAVLAVKWKNGLKFKTRHREEQKREAQQTVELLFNKKATQDEADAVCIGIYYLKTFVYNEALAKEDDFNWV